GPAAARRGVGDVTMGLAGGGGGALAGVVVEVWGYPALAVAAAGTAVSSGCSSRSAVPVVVSVAPVTEPPTTPAPVPAAVTALSRELMDLGGPNTLIWPSLYPNVVALTTSKPVVVSMLLLASDST